MIHDLREQYMARGLDESDLASDPIEQLNEWLESAVAAGLRLTEAMVLATVDPAGRPSARTVLLKGADERGLGFYTNYRSRKGRELDSNPHAALLFVWNEISRQIRVTGEVSRASEKDSDEYFATRGRGAMIEAWASRQSEEIASRDALETSFAELEGRFEGAPVPRPDHCGLYRLDPDSFEFWQGRPDRMHDRLEYVRAAHAGGWTVRRLSP